MVYKIGLIAVWLIFGLPLFATIDEDNLKKVAEIDGYGYKYGNLVILKDLIKDIKTDGYKISVPDFAGIPSKDVQKFIDATCNFNMADQWKKLIEENLPSAKDKRGELLLKRVFPEKFIDALGKFKSFLDDEFDKCLKDITKDTKLVDELFKTADIEQLVKSVSDADGKLMVRSSGREDKKNLANAGGNETIGNVSPEPEKIVESIFAVVASYVAKKSLTQRLDAGDETIFEVTPFTPILLQRMIGEDENIPGCGVMFTEEPEGGTFFRTGKTSGITVIQAAYGSNELVVNSRGAVDSFYVSPSGKIYSVLRSKDFRLVPAGEGVFSKKDNPPKLRTKPALGEPAVVALKSLGNALEKNYQWPMDVEFLVKDKTIYLVQARPLVRPKVAGEPSYLAHLDKILGQNKLQGSAIGVAGGALRYITSAAQVVVAGNIREALDRYHELDPTKISAIVVGKMAPSTSHEATVFRGEGKPVTYLPDYATVSEWLKKSPLVIDPQQGVVVRGVGEESSVDDLIKSQKAIAGWASYPLPMLLTVPLHSYQSEAVAALIKGLLPESVVVDNKSYNADELLKIIVSEPISSVPEALAKIKTSPKVAAQVELARLIYWVDKRLNDRIKGLENDKYLKLVGDSIVGEALAIAIAIKPHLAFDEKHESHYLRLFHLRFLESVLLQQPLWGEVIDGYSAITLLGKILKPEQELKELGIKNPYAVQLAKVKSVAFTTDLADHWLAFVNGLKKPEEFSKLVINLMNLELLPAWLNTSFANAYQKDLKADEIAKVLEKEYEADEKFLSALFEQKKALAALSIANFADPSKFASQWQELQKVLKFFAKDPFAKEFNDAGDLGKIAALSVMTKLVTAFDESIKAMKGSPQFELEVQLKNFKDMLVKYHELSSYLVKNMVKNGVIPYYEFGKLSYANHFEFIETVLKRDKFTKNDLDKSKDFDVMPFTLGSAANIEYKTDTSYLLKNPETLEDAFMNIHQNLLVILSAAGQGTSLSKVTRPELLNKVESAIVKLTSPWGRKHPKLLGIDLESGSLTLHYNLPIREHSQQIDLRFDKKSKTVLVSLKYFGPNEEGRWDMVAESFGFLNGLSIFHRIESTESKASVTVDVELGGANASEQIDLLIAAVTTLNDYTIGKNRERVRKAIVDEAVSTAKKLGSVTYGKPGVGEETKILSLMFIDKGVKDGLIKTDEKTMAKLVNMVVGAQLHKKLPVEILTAWANDGLLKQEMLHDIPESIYRSYYRELNGFNSDDLKYPVEGLLIALKNNGFLKPGSELLNGIIYLAEEDMQKNIKSLNRRSFDLVNFFIDKEFITAGSKDVGMIVKVLREVVEAAGKTYNINVEQMADDLSFGMLINLANKGLLKAESDEISAALELAILRYEKTRAVKFLEIALYKKLLSTADRGFAKVVKAIATAAGKSGYQDARDTLKMLLNDGAFNEERVEKYMEDAIEDLKGDSDLAKKMSLGLIEYLAESDLIAKDSDIFKKLITAITESIKDMSVETLADVVEFFQNYKISSVIDNGHLVAVLSGLSKAMLQRQKQITGGQFNRFFNLLQWALAYRVDLDRNNKVDAQALDDIFAVAEAKPGWDAEKLMKTLVEKGHGERVAKFASGLLYSKDEKLKTFGKDILEWIKKPAY